MLRVRQVFPRPRLADIPGGVRATLGAARLPIKRGDTVAVGAGSRGIANIDAIDRRITLTLREFGETPQAEQYQALKREAEQSKTATLGDLLKAQLGDRLKAMRGASKEDK